jgi:hypothetical protein
MTGRGPVTNETSICTAQRTWFDCPHVMRGADHPGDPSPSAGASQVLRSDGFRS